MTKYFRKRLFLASALVGISLGAFANDFTFSGYMRASTGVSAVGGSQVCFGLPGADTKWRLGNECDYDVEPTFDFKVAEFEGSPWHVVAMAGMRNRK